MLNKLRDFFEVKERQLNVGQLLSEICIEISKKINSMIFFLLITAFTVHIQPYANQIQPFQLQIKPFQSNQFLRFSFYFMISSKI